VRLLKEGRKKERKIKERKKGHKQLRNIPSTGIAHEDKSMPDENMQRALRPSI